VVGPAVGGPGGGCPPPRGRVVAKPGRRRRRGGGGPAGGPGGGGAVRAGVLQAVDVVRLALVVEAGAGDVGVGVAGAGVLPGADVGGAGAVLAVVPGAAGGGEHARAGGAAAVRRRGVLGVEGTGVRRGGTCRPDQRRDRDRAQDCGLRELTHETTSFVRPTARGITFCAGRVGTCFPAPAARPCAPAATARCLPRRPRRDAKKRSFRHLFSLWSDICMKHLLCGRLGADEPSEPWWARAAVTTRTPGR